MGQPFINPSILLLDPQFTDTFSVTQRVQQTNTYGEVTTTPNVLPKVKGIVTPTTKADLERLPEAQRGNRNLTIITRQHLNSAARGLQPDLITWRGDKFVVRLLLPWTAYGPGWVKAVVGSIDSVEAST
jgi:hypothetical protein